MRTITHEAVLSGSEVNITCVMDTGEADGMSIPLFEIMFLFHSLHQAESVIKQYEKKPALTNVNQ